MDFDILGWDDPSILGWDEISNKQGARSAEASISSHLSNGSGKQKQQHQLLPSTNNNINSSSSSSSSWRWDPLLLPPSVHGDGSVGGKMNDSGQTDTQSSAPSALPSVYTTQDMKQPVSDGNVGASSILNNNMNNNALLAPPHSSSNNTVVTSSSSALNDAAAAYFLNQGGQINHPLAMTSMSSCPPYGAQKDPQQDTSRNAIAAPSSHPSLTTTNAISHQQQQQQQSNATSDTQNGTFASHLSELTANFNASNNSGIGTCHVPLPLHYGMTVNGFHPQLNAQVNPVFLMGCSQQQQLGGVGSTTPAASSAINNTIFLRQQQQVHNMSAAHAAANNNTSMSLNARNARDRNEREQVRAKKITQLITELRENMQQGGWKEEMNSKYQTLSQCREYMEHLKRSHKAKEADIEQAKKLVEEHKQHHKKQQQQPSASSAPVIDDQDLDGSATSSITNSTARSTDDFLNEEGSEKSSSSTMTGEDSQILNYNTTTTATKKKRKKVTMNDDVKQAPPYKKSRKSSPRRGKSKQKREVDGEDDEGQSSAETSSMSHEYDRTRQVDSPGGKNISFTSQRAYSSVSDMTDSNRSSTDGGTALATSPVKTTSSISSTAVVVRGVAGSSENSSRRRVQKRELPPVKEDTNTAKAAAANTGLANKKKKRKRKSFQYDYREVFVKSTVPQLIATLSGRIVVWNDFFLCATGLTEEEVKNLTLFNIVQNSQLSNLYKMVAGAFASRAAAVGSTHKTSHNDEWPKAITLSCASFPNDKVASSSSATSADKEQLYITVALMEDENRDQRCFHCILTNCQADGKVGSLMTQDLFAKLFAPEKQKKKVVATK